METSGMSRLEKQQGMGVITMIALTPLLLIALVILAFVINLFFAFSPQHAMNPLKILEKNEGGRTC